ncbi:MAG: hypothetical protein FWG89_10330 [Treponema sp.]|nr:hypothetical protein [Treponema sp.]
MNKKLLFAIAAIIAVLAVTGCEQELFQRGPPLPIPPYDIETGYEPFEGPNAFSPPQPAWIKSAEVTGNPSVIQVTFSASVSLQDASHFKVKVNDQPAVRIGWFSGSNLPMLDRGSEIRTVTDVESGTGSNSDTIWFLTMSAPAKHGEILRLAADDRSAYMAMSDFGVTPMPAPVSTPAGQWPLSQFIVRNLVPRTETSPSAPGFYRNGANITSQLPAGTNENLYQRAITWLTEAANRTTGATYTIVLGADQNYAAANTFTAAQVSAETGTAADNAIVGAQNGFTVVLAADGTERVITVTGTGPGDGPRGAHGEETTNFTRQDGSALVLRHGVTLIIERNVVIEHENQGLASGTLSKYPLIAIRDGGKLILDGGEIRGNYVTAGTRGTNSQKMNAGGVFIAPTDDTVNECTRGGQAFFIMNSGKVTGNSIQQNERGVAAGGIVLHRKAYFIMHGGEVSNNTFVYNSNTGTANSPIHQFYAGGITGFGSTTDNDSSNGGTNLAGIYITGGTIENNEITNSNAAFDARITTGGIALAGTFQKTGGSIRGNTNSLPSGVSSVGRYRQVVVNHAVPATVSNNSPKTAAHIFFRNEDAGEDVMLFHEGIRTVMGDASSTTSGGRVFGAGFKPPFMPSFGTAATGFFPNSWEN